MPNETFDNGYDEEVGHDLDGVELHLGNRIDGELLTPPIDCGLLAGTMRATLLARGEVREQIVTRDDLERCVRIWVMNSVRGRREAVLVGAEQAEALRARSPIG